MLSFAIRARAVVAVSVCVRSCGPARAMELWRPSGAQSQAAHSSHLFWGTVVNQSKGGGSVEPRPLPLASAGARWLIAAAVLGSGIALLDATVVNVALPAIGRDLGGV